jgi:hypothetical protein
MISDVGSNEIVLVRKAQSASKPIASAAEAQLALDEIGTLHNLQLSKLSQSGRVIFVEGKDHAFLSDVAFKLGPAVYDRFALIPSFPVGGYENWRRAALAATVFNAASIARIKSYLVLDRDYRSEAELAKAREDAKGASLEIVNWRRKEIENYFADAKLIYRYLAENAPVPVVEAEVTEKFEEVVDRLASRLPAMVAESFRSANRKLDIPQALDLAEELISERQNAGCTMRDMVSGKHVLSQMSEFCKANYKTSFSPMTLCRTMKAADIPSEMRKVIENLCDIKA